jgi:hypothetical protein
MPTFPNLDTPSTSPAQIHVNQVRGFLQPIEQAADLRELPGMDMSDRLWRERQLIE